jgi:hypothetical protein
MTLRIEKANDGAAPVIRLIGRIRSAHLNALRAELKECSGMRPDIDLAEVTNLDLEAVRFLSDRELEGSHLLNCSPFIREWIQRERDTKEIQ